MSKSSPLLEHNNTSSLGRAGRPLRLVWATSRTSLSTSSLFRARTGAPRADSPTLVQTATLKSKDSRGDEPWMATATPGKFSDFQKMILPIIEYLTAKPEHANHVFIKKWATLKRSPNMPMVMDISWRHMKMLLGINNMHQYKDFIATCPDLNTAVKLHSSTSARSRFDFGVLRNFKMDISPPSIQDCSSPVLGSDGEPYVLVPDSEDVIQTTEDAIQEIPKLQSLQHQLQQLASKIETKFAETDAQIKRYEESLIDFASMIFGKFKNNINDFTENYLETQRVEITNMTQANQETLHDYILRC
jgi:hypothetical protein